MHVILLEPQNLSRENGSFLRSDADGVRPPQVDQNVQDTPSPRRRRDSNPAYATDPTTPDDTVDEAEPANDVAQFPRKRVTPAVVSRKPLSPARSRLNPGVGSDSTAGSFISRYMWWICIVSFVVFACLVFVAFFPRIKNFLFRSKKDSNPNAEQLAHLKHLCSPDAEIMAQMGVSNIFADESQAEKFHGKTSWLVEFMTLRYRFCSGESLSPFDLQQLLKQKYDPVPKRDQQVPTAPKIRV
eukprot:TRINITY_DN13708_c0_g1_i1.p1 TRINITY_DN13708_c0_g1~~TRINITY_DN13708_c0_g1_i1.p1  ORF type:complete len:242 (+),score=44.25 TRINITY_DN13708_c0_g1_i1:74-799(+)